LKDFYNTGVQGRALSRGRKKPMIDRRPTLFKLEKKKLKRGKAKRGRGLLDPLRKELEIYLVSRKFFLG